MNKTEREQHGWALHPPASFVFLALPGCMPVDAVGRLLAAVVAVGVGVVVMVGLAEGVTVWIKVVGLSSLCLLERSPVCTCVIYMHVCMCNE